MKGTKPAVGDPIVVWRTWRRHGTDDENTELGEVSRVGRTLFDVTIKGRHEFVRVFSMATWTEKHDTGEGCAAFTPAEWAERPERLELLGRFRGYLTWDGYSTDQLRRMVAIMDETP